MQNKRDSYIKKKTYKMAKNQMKLALIIIEREFQTPQKLDNGTSQ